MKTLNKILPLAFICLGLTSCLKDELYTADTSDAPNIVEFSAEPSESAGEGFIYPVYSSSLDFLDEVELPITISYSGTNNAPSDITVDVQVDAAALTKFNTEAEAELFTQAPSSFYTIPSNTVTIKKGEKTTTFIVKIKPKLIDYDHDYAIPLSIKSATGSTVSGNFGTALFNIVAKNEYDGDYHATGVFTHPTAGPRAIDRDKVVSTTGKYTVSVEAGDLGSPVDLEIDPVTNNVTISGGLSASQPFVPIPGKTNTYDPATKTFHLNYQYTGGGGFRVIEEDIVKK